MRRENGIRKGLNRLLVLVLAIAVTMVFSFTGVFAEVLATNDDVSKTEGNNKVAVQGQLPTHKNNDPYTVYIYAQLQRQGSSQSEVGQLTVDGLGTYKVNSDGWVTLGKLENGIDVMPSSTYKNSYSDSGKIQDLVDKVKRGEFTEYNSSNSAELRNKLLTHVQDDNWKLHTANGAADYFNSNTSYADTWHLDGIIPIYKITYDKNGSDVTGNVPTSDTYYMSGGNATVFGPGTLQRPNYTFAGWKSSVDREIYQENSKINLNSDVTLTAQWTENKKVNVHYDLNGGKGNLQDETVYENSDYTISNADVTKTNYTFAGWKSSIDGKTYTGGKSIKVGNENVTLTAIWSKNNTPTTPVTPTPSEEHKVIITPNNGDADITQTVPDGGKAVEPDDLTNDGYELDGWYTDSAMTQPFDFSQPIKSDIHIYAKWTKTNEPVTPAKPSKKVSGILLPKVIAKGKHTQTLTWTSLKNVDGYFIYTNHCDEGKKLHPFKKVADYKASKARVYTRKNLKTYHNYKYYVAAYKIKNGKKVVVRNSVTVHSVCGNTSARSTNVKSVKVKKHAVTLKKGKTYKVKATISKVNKKRAFLDATHCGLLRYLTADSKIADVNYNTGVIKAKKAGKTMVYVLGVNGIRDKVTVTVK